MIIGCGGSGKSTLAQKISTRLGLEHISLDQYFWRPGWISLELEEWIKVCTELANKDSWVMDGNYGSSMKERIPRADTIIFLYYPTFTCLSRVIKRTWKNYGKTRPGMTENCPERFSLEFLHYILLYNKTRAPQLLKKLKSLEGEKEIYILRNDQEVQFFLETLSN